MLAPPELKEIHPLGKAPILVIESDARPTPLVLAESGNMIEYLIDHYGSRLAPRKFLDGKEGEVGGETEEWLRYRYYMHYAEGTMMVYLVIALIVGSAQYLPFIRSALLSIQPQTSENPLRSFSVQLPMPSPAQLNLCGSELSGADFIMSFPLSAAKSRAGLTQQKYPHLWAYIERYESTESYTRAVKKIIEIEGAYDPTL